MTSVSNKRLDLALIAGRRPVLLQRTLESFAEKLFCNFEIGKVVANVDPFMGTAADTDICCDIIKSYFPQAQINTPDTPSFGAAVKYLWSNMGDSPCLHMEDDWLCLEDVRPEHVFPFFDDPDTGMAFFSHGRQRRPGELSARTRTRVKKIWKFKVSKREVSDWGTSPRFLSGPKAQLFAQYLDPSKDPEKQVYRQSNKALCRIQEQSKTFCVWGDEGRPILKDIGREYREEHNCKKIDLPDGSVRWEVTS